MTARRGTAAADPTRTLRVAGQDAWAAPQARLWWWVRRRLFLRRPPDVGAPFGSSSDYHSRAAGRPGAAQSRRESHQSTTGPAPTSTRFLPGTESRAEHAQCAPAKPPLAGKCRRPEFHRHRPRRSQRPPRGARCGKARTPSSGWPLWHLTVQRDLMRLQRPSALMRRHRAEHGPGTDRQPSPAAQDGPIAWDLEVVCELATTLAGEQ